MTCARKTYGYDVEVLDCHDPEPVDCHDPEPVDCPLADIEHMKRIKITA